MYGLLHDQRPGNTLPPYLHPQLPAVGFAKPLPSKCAPEGLSQIVVHQMSSEHLGCGSQSNSIVGRVFPLHMADWVHFSTLHLILKPH